MAWTSVGFDGTITEIQWAGLSSLLGNGYVAAGNGDCVVTAVGGARQVSVAAGSLYGDGVLSTNSGAETVALTTPTNGQWYVVALRRTWATNTAALVAIAGATTTTTTPTAPPTSFPTLNTNVGVLTDQPIAWAWCNSANTTVVVYDIRLKAVKSLPPVVATSAERDAKFMTPTQGTAVWRDDLGAVETYYGLYNVSTNPGGRDTAGWYVDTRQTGLIPLQPTSVGVNTGTGSVNSMGQFSFSGATAVILNGVFSSKYKRYRLSFVSTGSTGGGQNLFFRYSTGGTVNSSTGYSYDNIYHTGGISVTAVGENGVSYVQTGAVYSTANAAGYSNYHMEINNPYESTPTITFANGGASISGSGRVELSTSTFNNSQSFDGIYIYPGSGTITGYIQVHGIAD